MLNIEIANDVEEICREISPDFLAGKTFLLTGASGLMGSYFLHCIHRWISKHRIPTKIFAVVRSNPPNHLTDCFSNPSIEFLYEDLSQIDCYRKLPNADYIIHAAGYGQPGAFLQNKRATFLINTSATIALLDKLNQGGRFLYLSTSEVYSGLGANPHKESEIGTTNTDHPRSCYIEAKRCGEAICNSYREMGVDAKSARLCLAYGPGTRSGDKRAINTFIQKALTLNRIDLLDSGQSQRTYCYIKDAILLLWKILLHGKESTYNVGGVSRVSIAELATLVGNMLNVPIFIPKDEHTLKGAPTEVSVDLDKVSHEFGLPDFVSIEEGLTRTISWQKTLY